MLGWATFWASFPQTTHGVKYELISTKKNVGLDNILGEFIPKLIYPHGIKYELILTKMVWATFWRVFPKLIRSPCLHSKHALSFYFRSSRWISFLKMPRFDAKVKISER
jgi:hypothetical protein